MQEFTVEELRLCNGVDRPELYVALDGKVYDVSSGERHYGKGGGYHLFAGRDASRALAKGSLEESILPETYDDLSDLSDDERKMLEGWASTFEKYPIVGALVKLKYGVKNNDPPPARTREATDIFEAAKMGDTSRLETFIKEVGDLEATDHNGMTALQCAAKAGEVDCIHMLLDAGASINGENVVTGETPLIYACAAGHVGAVRVLLERGADHQHADRLGSPPLLTASANGSAEVLRTLLDAGADISQHDREGWQALHWAAGKGQCECIQLLLDRGAELEAQDMHGHTPLAWAGKMGKAEAWDLLRQRGADDTVENNQGYIPTLVEKKAGGDQEASCCIQ